MSRLQSIAVAIARVPLDNVTSIARRTITHRHYCLIRVTGENGQEGLGFCYVGSAGGAIARTVVTDLLGHIVLGEESLDTERLWQAMYAEALLHGRTGTVMRVLSAIDIALWDLNARSAGLPLAKYLGCHKPDRVPVYASGGYYTDGKGTEGLVAEMAGYLRAGFRAVKMKVGRLPAAQEAERVRAAREAIGPDIPLMLDANNAWPDLETALASVCAFEKYAPYWIEEPFSPDDIENHARLAKRTSITVATGEIEAGRWRFKEILERGAAEILQPDACVCGGISEFRRIADLAAGYGVSVCPHWFHDLHIHLVASQPNATYVEFFPDDQVLNFRRLITQQLEMQDGMLCLPTGPGLSFRFDENAVRTCSDTPEPWLILERHRTQP